MFLRELFSLLPLYSLLTYKNSTRYLIHLFPLILGIHYGIPNRAPQDPVLFSRQFMPRTRISITIIPYYSHVLIST